MEQVNIINENIFNLCKEILKVLNCNLLWIIVNNSDFLNVSVTDKAIFNHYFDNKYYIKDPEIQINTEKHIEFKFKINLATDCHNFKENGFLYDLYKNFHITEFASIQCQEKSKNYCFRFFTQDNRFVFMNHLIRNIPIIKAFIFNCIKYFSNNQKVYPNHYNLFKLQ